MGQITLTKRNGAKVILFSKDPFCTVSNAVQNITLMGDDNVQLTIKSTRLIDFGKGDKILINGEEYSIRTQVTRELLSENMYSYDAVFYGVMYELMKSQYRNCDASGKSTKSTFDLTYSLADFMKVVIYNVSRDYPGIWRFDADSCPDTDPITLQFSKQNCLQVVQTVCKEYKYEFRIDQENGIRTIRVGKFGTKVTPPAGNAFFEWGKGNGLYKLKEQKVDDKSIITRLWVEGGTQNIRSDYRDYSERLQLPYPKRLNQREHTLSDGTVISAKSEYIGIDDDTKRYIEDPELRNEIGSDEDTEYYDEICPKRTGTVTALGGDVYSFVDSSMDFDLTEKDANGSTKYLIDGVTAKITFISGKLAGQQFELKDKGGYVHASKTFSIIKYTDERGLELPTANTDAFRIQIGDKYKITEINLPKSYEDYAEEDLWYAGYDDFMVRKQARAQYILTFDRPYFINSLPLDSEICVFHCGDYIPVKDPRFNIEKNIRIQKISRNLLLDHDYTLTLSDTTNVSIQAQTVLDVIEHNIIIDNNRLRDLNKARRGWRTTEELRNMVYDTDGFFDPENIRPNSIDTNMLTVGSKSQQFVLIDTIFQANVNGLPNRFDATTGILAHLSIDDETIRKWNMAGASITLSESGGYYVFAKCSKKGNSGIFYVTQEQLKFEPVSDPNNYYFQIGIIGSLRSDDNFRDFVTTYGFTRINGNTITTGKIVTSDGECYLDLDGNKFRIGDATSSIDWNVSAKKRLTLRNVQLLSDSGDTSNIGVYRGTYNGSYVYYTGDEVSYTVGGETCTYRFINPNPAKGMVPTNSTYWAVIAKGSPGDKGDKGDQGEKGDKGVAGEKGADGKTSYFHVKYSAVANPTTASQMTETPSTYIGTYVDFIEADSNDPSKYTWCRFEGLQGENGEQGIPGINGTDGKTSYLHIKYSNDGGKTLTANNGETPGDYIGQYVDHIQADSSDVSKYTWSRIKGDPGVQGIQGDKGEQGIPGKDGTSGKTTYFHIKYSSIQNPTTSSQMTETPSAYIGTYVDYTEADSTDPKKYTWARFQGLQGEDGLPGINGENGQTSYLHIKYSDNGGLSFTSNNGENPGDYIGQYTDFNKKDSDKPGDYTWSRIKGESGSSGTDATAGEYYEYRYAKNGSTSTPPSLNVSATNPDGWSKVMPKPGALEYVWCTMAKKSGIADKTVFNLPVNLSDYTSVTDVSGNGYNGMLGDGAKVTKVGNTGCVLDLSSNAECRIPYDLPFGESFTLCFMMSTSEKVIKWMLNGYNGRDYIEKSLSVDPYSWFNLAFRFNDRTVTVFVNGNQVQTGSVNESVVGFALYDDNIFGSEVYFDNIRLLRGALPVEDINKVITGEVDTLVQNWSTPVRVNPYDGIDGKDGVGVTLTDVEYAKSSSNSTAPTSGWQTTAPAWENGKYIWSRTKVVYTDGSTNYTKAACITGGVGETGSAGVGVSSIVEQYYLSSSYSTQTGGSWSTTRPAWKDGWYIWTRSIITYTNGTSTTTSPICVTGGKGETGDKGDTGEKGDSPAAVFRGVYSDSNTYYGTKYRLDVVKYNGVYYVARIDAGTFSGKAPTDTSKWNTFGAQFESVATQLLLAEYANLGGLIFKDEKLISQTGYIGNSDSSDFSNANFKPNIEIDGKNGRIYLNGFFASRFSTSYETTQDSYPKTMNFIVTGDSSLNFDLPNTEMYIGSILTVYIDKTITGSNSVRIGSPVYGGFPSYKGQGIMLLTKNKGTIVRLMATKFVDNRLQWELINFDEKLFSIVTVGGLTIIDKSRVDSERVFYNFQELFNYWNTI